VLPDEEKLLNEIPRSRGIQIEKDTPDEDLNGHLLALDKMRQMER